MSTSVLSPFSKSAARWAALDSDDDEAPAAAAVPLTLAEICAADPIFQALNRGDLLWGDIILAAEAPRRPVQVVESWESVHRGRKSNRRVRFADEPPSPEEVAATALRAADAAEATFWAQPFARNLEAHGGDWLDLTGLSDAEYEAVMSWLYSHGWALEHETRAGVRAVPSDEPPRVWVPPSRFVAAVAAATTAAAKPLSAPGTDAGRRKGAPVPRFCRAAGGCGEAGCRYVHGDTIPRVNRPCGFGETCGASDPTGVKRSQCLYMHPGETWEEGLVIRRPAFQ
jgi:hypothetical protein